MSSCCPARACAPRSRSLGCPARSLLRVLVVATIVATAVPVRAGDDADVAGERIGPLLHGMADGAVRRVAGKPRRAGAPTYAGEATADWEKTWTYAGATITFAGDREHARVWTIRRIEVTRGSRWKTQRGIGIGAPRARVERAYAKEKDVESSSDERLVAGSIYGGVIFTFARGKVASIFVGAESF